MDIIKVKSNLELSELAATIVMDVLREKTQPVLGLATGSTLEKMYKLLVEKYEQKEISFQHAVTFNLDEYIGLSADDQNSYHYYMNKHLFHAVDIKKENIYVPNGMATNLAIECDEYEQQIDRFGKIDLQILGVGPNGHIGFNEPGTAFTERTHVVDLEESTREANARFFPSITDVPTKAITMGIGTIMEAKQIILLVQGEHKAEILQQIVHGGVTEDVPASVLQRHPNALLITDIDV